MNRYQDLIKNDELLWFEWKFVGGRFEGENAWMCTIGEYRLLVWELEDYDGDLFWRGEVRKIQGVTPMRVVRGSQIGGDEDDHSFLRIWLEGYYLKNLHPESPTALLTGATA